jgi:hypothetical protein
MSESLEQRIEIIEERNKRVELDKAWETSGVRRIAIAILTYIVVLVFFIVAEIKTPFINALVPTLGFLLSTLSLSFLKNYWIQMKLK